MRQGDWEYVYRRREGARQGYVCGQSEPLDLGATDLDDERARGEHGLDRPAEFDQCTGVDEPAETRATLLPKKRRQAAPPLMRRHGEVLRDSEVRTEVPGAAPDTVAEQRPSGP